MFLQKYLEPYKNYIKELSKLDRLLKSKNNLQNNSFQLEGIRIYLTENCNANCSHCFNSKIREARHMNVNKLFAVFKYLNENKVKSLKIMGGEPTIHPDFIEIYKMSQQYFQHVNLFTNALNEKVLSINPRDTDAIIYNFIFATLEFDFKKLLPDFPNLFRIFEIVIDSNTDQSALFKQIDFVHKNCLALNILPEKILYQLTFNCVENIFDNKIFLNNLLIETIFFILNLSPKSISFDHRIPYCFWLPKTISFMKEQNLDYYSGSCWGNDFGLIDADFNLLHCNQHPIKLLPIFYNDNVVNFNILKNTLVKANLEKRLFNLNKACLNCNYFNIICTGGCLMHKDIVKLETINSN